ncbi:hypothetical protein LTR10_016017 [Elasticomyces elasticus]|uniref:TauD/TfdA-like domain-containing protein n=1 Tax=Exophiala sideris TaxID=1016849 RepID=A0ABR0J287_9EURO|nr:hypothetical protein LTR10_016017 [Elasticomyces elasticus]KAK5024645.1 hypothetical protein LTS07_008491 [Exophiala sideris]KAK5030738.1 hypothetical protein LTR13_008092 [Exophiala sideris]KAK5054278.1 hypothetical protein LTR69_008893 [Exophiala sideris]KAK5179680.1 hypothetical protein LTR44_007848 [Eurotiomycetes sp. CCFEE 6388]
MEAVTLEPASTTELQVRIGFSLITLVALYMYWQRLNAKPLQTKIPLKDSGPASSTCSSGAGHDQAKQLDFTNVVPYKPNFHYEDEEPIPWYEKDFISDRVYSITMAIEKLAFNDWIVFDKNYKKRMDLKAKVLEEVGSDAIDCREGGYDGCVEMLECLVEYLPRRFPTIFTLSADKSVINNLVTGESFNISKPYNKHHPLYIAGRLVEDDLNILVEGPSGEYVLKAVLSAFPAGFHVRDKMDKSLTEIHQPVPTYRERLRKSMNRFFKSVDPSKMVLRVNWSINDHEELFLTEGGHLYENDVGEADESIDINQVQLRVERQVLRRLPRTKAICFVTKTYLYRLVDIAETPGFAVRLGGLLHKLPEKFAFYKRKPVWGKVVLAYLDKMAAKYPAES